VKVWLTVDETAALQDFIYNLGVGAFGSSTLLRKLNAGDYDGAAAELIRLAVNRHDVVIGIAAGGTLRRGLTGLFEYSRRALSLVWTTNRPLSIALAGLTLFAGVLPAGIAYLGALIVDAVIRAADLHHHTGTVSLSHVFVLVSCEAALIAATSLAQRGISLAQSLLRAQLGQRVNVMILEKALTLDMQQFEDSEFYDKLTRAREAGRSHPPGSISGPRDRKSAGHTSHTAHRTGWPGRRRCRRQ